MERRISKRLQSFDLLMNDADYYMLRHDTVTDRQSNKRLHRNMISDIIVKKTSVKREAEERYSV